MATVEATVGREPSVWSRWSSLLSPLWLSVFLFAGTDIVTTWMGITFFGAHEANPVVAPMLGEVGFLVMIPLKLFAIAVAIGFTNIADDNYEWALPLALALVWGAVTLWNLSLFALAL